MERKRSPVGPVGELQGDAEVEQALSQVTQAAQKAWLKVYPDAVWIKTEILKATAWLEVNPRKRAKSFARFMGNWLSRGWEQHRKSIPSTGFTGFSGATPSFDFGDEESA